MVGGSTTVKVAVAAEPVMPWASVTVPVVLVLTPTAVPVTLTVKMQLAPGASVPALKLILFVPAVAVTLPVPQGMNPLGVEITSPAGSVSVKARPVKVTALPAGLVSVKVREVELLTARFAVPNDFVRVGGLADEAETETVSEPDAAVAKLV